MLTFLFSIFMYLKTHVNKFYLNLKNKKLNKVLNPQISKIEDEYNKWDNDSYRYDFCSYL